MEKGDWPSNAKETYWWFYLAGWESSMTAISIGVALVVATAYATSGHSWIGLLCLILFLAVCLVLYAAATISSVWKEAYQKRYDPTLALKYVDIFFRDMEEIRSLGTLKAIEFVNQPESIKTEKTSELDDILDVLDDIGFLVEGHQISDWVAYHYFFHWLQIYYESCASYITYWQNKEPPRWAYIKPLYDDLVVIEAHKAKIAKEKVALEKPELIKRLEAERRSLI